MGPKRNNIQYIKPEEPAFLRRIKQEIGYQEGPDVDTKVSSFSECLTTRLEYRHFKI
jgi:hypothetical protein